MDLCFNHPVVCCSPSLSLTTPTFPLSPCCLYIIGMSYLRRRRQQPAVYASEQVCIRWHRTDACYTDKLTFSPQFFHQSLGCVLYKCAYYIRIFTVCIKFRQNNLYLASLPRISANSNEKYSNYNFQALANISGNFRKISRNIKFPENLQP